MMTLTIPLSFSITTNQFDNPRQLQWNLWMDRHKEPYTTCSVCTFVPTLTLDQISVIVQVYNLFALPAMPIAHQLIRQMRGNTERYQNTCWLAGADTNNAKCCPSLADSSWSMKMWCWVNKNLLRNVRWLCKLVQMYRQVFLSTCEIFLQICPVRTLSAC